MNIEIPQNKYNNLTREERRTLYDLKNDKTIVIKRADKGSMVVVWDRENYIKEAEKQYVCIVYIHIVYCFWRPGRFHGIRGISGIRGKL